MERTLYGSMDAQNMAELVELFYPKVLKDPVLAPFFTKKLGEDINSPQWKTHLHTVLEFWKFLALGYDEYTNNPFQPHANMQGLSREIFEQWLHLFYETIYEVYEPYAGDYLKDKSNAIAENFMKKLEL